MRPLKEPLVVFTLLIGVCAASAAVNGAEPHSDKLYEQFQEEHPPTTADRVWHYTTTGVTLAQSALFLAGAIILLRKEKGVGSIMMTVAMACAVIGGIASHLFKETINDWELVYLVVALWPFTTLLFGAGFLTYALQRRKA